MKPLSNTTILIELKNGKRKCFAVPRIEKPVDAYKRLLKIEEIKKTDIERWIAFDKSLYSPEQYEKYWNSETGEMDDVAIVTERKLEDIRRQRARMWPLLDMEFMKSLEEDCEECKEHVVRTKNYLRDLPDLLEKEFKTINEFEKISSFNPFNNIFFIQVSNPGAGYENPPLVQANIPNGNYTGFRLKAAAMLNDEGEVGEIMVTQIGSGYRYSPYIKIGPPNDPNGEIAQAVASSPENDIIENVSWKETRRSDEDYEKSIERLFNNYNNITKEE